jgi:abortive infection bacteriophage resistance protein
MRTSVGFFMDTIKYTKQSLTLDEQINFLKNQGLIIEDPKIAKYVLIVVGYYRLSGYLLPFKSQHQHQSPRQFKPKTSFDQIWQLYQFDRELRLLTLDAIEKIEVAFRSTISNVTSIEFNPFWYTDQSYHRDKTSYLALMKNIKKVMHEKNETFIKHYVKKYHEPKYPPIWIIIETLSFGACSKLFKNIKPVAVRQEICKTFEQHSTVIESWVQTLTYIRNICAHHARLWNRWVVNAPLIPKNDKYRNQINVNNRKFIIVAYIVFSLLKTVAPKSPWRNKLFKLFEKYESIPGHVMGFQNNWREDPFWKL